jgi:hypothetical protein
MRQKDIEDLQQIFLDDDAERRIRRTAQHEAGHAAAAWLIRDAIDAPPFEYIELGTLEQHAGGIVPGGVKYDAKWFETLVPVDKGAILLAGVYAQEYDQPYSADEWRDLLDGLDGADGIDDYARAMEVASEIGQHQHEFDQQVLERLTALEPHMGAFTKLIASELSPGSRIPAANIVSRMMRMLAGASGGAS